MKFLLILVIFYIHPFVTELFLLVYDTPLTKQQITFPLLCVCGGIAELHDKA